MKNKRKNNIKYYTRYMGVSHVTLRFNVLRHSGPKVLRTQRLTQNNIPQKCMKKVPPTKQK